jgi:hypothetical protein
MIDHMPLRRRSLNLSKSILLCVLVATLGACKPSAFREADEPAVGPAPEMARLQQTITRQRDLITQLELRLLAQQVEIHRLSALQEQAIQEIVRTKSKLRSRNSKAETVASLAEVKLAVQGLQAEGRSGVKVERLDRALQYVAMSEVALQEGNYDGASYLIGQARVSLRSSQTPTDAGLPGADDTHSFHVPLRMTVTERCNVRNGPGMGHRILTQLDPGATVSASGYRGLWVRIQTPDAIAGWIHYSLLDAGD